MDVTKSKKNTKKSKHPKTRPVEVRFTNGDCMTIDMVYDREMLILNSDMFNHKAWKKEGQTVMLQSKARKFQEKFGDSLV